MSDQQEASSQSSRFEIRVTAESHFAWLRTRLAVERTMMAYMRTAISLIGFGFGIFQFVYSLQNEPEFGTARFPNSAWYLGLALIACGVLTAAFSLMEYRHVLRYLWSGSYAAVAGLDKEQRHTPLLLVTIVLIIVGLFAFFAVLSRMG
jgi:putative membrane protein